MSDPRDYTVGWICALPTELVASQAFLDERHGIPAQLALNDTNHYILGRIGGHNVAMAVLPDGEYGTASAANVASHMRHSFPNIRIGLMVGIGGGAPSSSHDIRLGDVVVSSRTGGQAHGGVFQYDYGKTIQGQAFQYTGFLDQPPTVLRTAVNGLKVKYEANGHALDSDIHEALKSIKKKKKYTRPSPSLDRLYKSDITHLDACGETCGGDESDLVPREERDEEDDDPAIHYGTIASANSLMKDAVMRDRLAAEKGVLCFEMEAAGLMNNFPCLVVRGICDYSDSHKNEEWQGFAAMAAAAYAKDLLRQIPPNKVEAERRIGEVLDSINENVQNVEIMASETKATVNSVRYDQRLGKIERWLSPPDPSTNANHARGLRHEGTGAWLLEHPAFREWHSGSRLHLWLQGLAGCGKTVLSGTVLDYLLETQDHTVLSFFFDFGDVRKQTVDGMLRSLAFQLYRSGGEAAAQIERLFHAHSDGDTQPATDALSNAVYKALQSSTVTSIVIDALDESTTRGELVRWIRGIASAPDLGHVRTLYTSRPEIEFLRAIPKLIGESGCIVSDKEAVNADIRAYVAARLGNDPDFAKWNLIPCVPTQIRDTIGDKADGMFRWAACQLESLKTCLDRESIESALRSLPKDLNATYDRMLEQVPHGMKHKALRLLQFLVYAKRPILLGEAVDIIAVRMDGRRGVFHIDDRMPVPSEITSLCPGLIVSVLGPNKWNWYLHPNQLQYWDREPKPQLHLAHFSVKEYLLRGVTHGFRRGEIETGVTETCMAYLYSVPSPNDPAGRTYDLQKLATVMFGNAAVEYETCSEQTGREVLRFLTDHYVLSILDVWLYISPPTSPSALSKASQFGLLRTAVALVSEGHCIVAPESGYKDALATAAAFGHNEILKFLLDQGRATQPAEDPWMGRPCKDVLVVASFGGNIEAVRLLLSITPNCDWKDSELHVGAPRDSSARGNQGAGKGVSDTVLRVGTANSSGAAVGRHATALEMAASSGHFDIVRVLLDDGADPQFQGDHRGSAVEAASRGGNLEIMKLLLDRGADANVPSRVFNALTKALLGGYQEIAQLLLENGADANCGNDHGTPLQIAAVKGLREATLSLLERGADINARGACSNATGDFYPSFYTALDCALDVGHQEIAQLLLDNGAKRRTDPE